MKRIHEYTFLLEGSRDDYRVVLYGVPKGDGLWAGFFVFIPEQGERLLRTGVETEQSTPEDLLYWAGGVTPAYLDGALARATEIERGHRETYAP